MYGKCTYRSLNIRLFWVPEPCIETDEEFACTKAYVLTVVMPFFKEVCFCTNSDLVLLVLLKRSMQYLHAPTMVLSAHDSA